MSILETISMMSKCGYTDKELLEYIDRHYDSIECELKGEVYREPKKRDHNFCIKCKLRKIVDHERLTSVCTRCGQFEFYPVMCHHTIIQCDIRKGNAYTKDLIILKLY